MAHKWRFHAIDIRQHIVVSHSLISLSHSDTYSSQHHGVFYLAHPYHVRTQIYTRVVGEMGVLTQFALHWSNLASHPLTHLPQVCTVTLHRSTPTTHHSSSYLQFAPSSPALVDPDLTPTRLPTSSLHLVTMHWLIPTSHPLTHPPPMGPLRPPTKPPASHWPNRLTGF